MMIKEYSRSFKMPKKTKQTKSKIKQKITKDTTLGEVVTKYPKAAEVMIKHGLHCVGCHVAAYETVEQGAMAHGMDKKEIKKLLDDMNEVVG